MSLLHINARPAEVRRGAIFAERFRSTAEIESNGGTIVGTVASYPTYSIVKTVIAKLKAADTGSNTVKINSGQTITITAGNIFGSYSNATAFDADDIQVDDYSKFEYVMISTAELSSDELTAYENGTMWDYDNNCILWMDGKMGRYDPDNNRHLDASPAKNHLTFGDDVTSSTYPTKLTDIPGGYSFDGINDYVQSGSENLDSDDITVVYNGSLGYNGDSGVLFHSDSSGKMFGLAMDASSLIVLANQKYGLVTAISKPLHENVLAVAINRTTYLSDVYVNGDLVESLTPGSAASASQFNNAFGVLNYRLLPSTSFHGKGTMRSGAVFKTALNQTQIIDVGIRMTEDRRA